MSRKIIERNKKAKGVAKNKCIKLPFVVFVTNQLKSLNLRHKNNMKEENIKQLKENLV